MLETVLGMEPWMRINYQLWQQLPMGRTMFLVYLIGERSFCNTRGFLARSLWLRRCSSWANAVPRPVAPIVRGLLLVDVVVRTALIWIHPGAWTSQFRPVLLVVVLDLFVPLGDGRHGSLAFVAQREGSRRWVPAIRADAVVVRAVADQRQRVAPLGCSYGATVRA